MTDDDTVEVVTTRLGATAMRDRVSGELMHPVIGPRVEANALYVVPSRIQARLATPGSAPLVLLDVGLGAGSNAVAAFHCATTMVAPARRLEIVSFERELAALAMALRPEHAEAFALTGEAGAAARALLHGGLYESERVRWRLVVGQLPGTLASEAPGSADIAFWDPYSPRANRELWTLQAFTSLRRVCRAGATVHTYSAATATRSALLLAGFAVGIGESMGEGKQTTIAAVDMDMLSHPLDRRWFERLARSSVPFPKDAPEDALARIGALPQFAMDPLGER